jgi:hypothetical protein
VLGLLESVERDGAQSQRKLASDLGIALGLVNAYLKRCVKKGLLKIGQAPARRYAYYLTPHGFAEKSRLYASYLTVLVLPALDYAYLTLISWLRRPLPSRIYSVPFARPKLPGTVDRLDGTGLVPEHHAKAQCSNCLTSVASAFCATAS